MANTPKKGLDYFPLEVGYFTDPKTELINAEFGVDGEYLFLRLLSIIYSDEGYYCEWNKDKALILAKKCGFNPSKIELILTRLVERSMFDKQLFHSAKVLTSRKIQKVYIRACKERQSIDIQKEFYLLNEQDKKSLPPTVLNKVVLFSKNQPFNSINLPINPIKPPINLQSKGKESKGNYIPPLPPAEESTPTNKADDINSELRAIWESYTFSPELSSAIREWINYIQEQKGPCKPRGLKGLLTTITQYSDKFGDEAIISLINECMGNNWKSIVWDRINKQSNKSNKSSGNKEPSYDLNAMFEYSMNNIPEYKD